MRLAANNRLVVEVGASFSCMEEACLVVFLGGLPEGICDGEVLFGIGFFAAEGRRASSCGVCCMRLLRVASRRLSKASMEALLKRRDATRSSRMQQTPQEEARRPSAAKNPIPKSTSPSQIPSGSPPKKTTKHASSMQEKDAPTSTTSRLLAAKRKKQQKTPNA